MSSSKTWTIHKESEWPNILPEILEFTKGYQQWQLAGQMGAGKTTFVGALGRYLGFSEVSSPTFSIVNEYPINNDKIELERIFHIDLYRLEPEELEEVGFEEYLYDLNALTIVEWPDIAEAYWVPPYARLELKEKDHLIRELMVILNPDL
jgi:tRNA threonylcarbamoyladenosine biosynthesis protein TsaE